MGAFFSELKRRKVYRVAVVYLIVGLGAAQGAADLFPYLGLPDWAVTLTIALVIVGFPVALLLAWSLELRREGETDGTSSAAAARLLRPKVLVVAILVLGLVGAGAVILLVAPGNTPTEGTATDQIGDQTGDTADRNLERVLVVPLQNQTGDPGLAPLGGLCAEWIEQGLIRAAIAHVVPMRQLRGSDSGADESGSEPSVETLIERAGPTTLVTGAYYLVGDEIEVHVDIRLVSEDRVLYKLDPATGASADPMEAFETVRSRVAGALAAHFGVDVGTPELRTPPPSLEAWRQMSLADDYFERQDYRRALEHTESAHALDTTFIAHLLRAVGSYANLGRLEEADSVLSFLQVRRHRLTQLEQLHLEWYESGFRGDLEGRYRAARQAFEMAPADWAYGAAFAAVRANHPSAALDYLALRDLTTSWGRNWAPWDYQHSNALFMLERDEEGLEVVRAAKARYPGDRILIDREAWALTIFGELDAVEPVVDEARALDAGFALEIMITVAEVLRSQGRTDESMSWARRARTEAESAPGDNRELRARSHYLAEEWEAALELFKSLSDEEPDNISRLGQLGSTLARLGRRQEAEAVIQRLEMPETPYLNGFNTRLQAYIRAILGDEDEALRLLEEAYARGVYHSAWVRSDIDLEMLRGNPRFERIVGPRG